MNKKERLQEKRCLTKGPYGTCLVQSGERAATQTFSTQPTPCTWAWDGVSGKACEALEQHLCAPFRADSAAKPSYLSLPPATAQGPFMEQALQGFREMLRVNPGVVSPSSLHL